MLHLPPLALAALATAIGVTGYELKKRYSAHHAATSNGVARGKSYVLTMDLKCEGAGCPPPTIADATEVLQHLGLYPHSLTQDKKDPNSFSTVAGYTGVVQGNALPKGLLPTGSKFKTAKGVTYVLAFPNDPVPYIAAAQTPAGAAIAAAAPPAGAVSGYWRQSARAFKRYGYGNKAYGMLRHRYPWAY